MLWVIVPSGRTADSYLWMIGLRFQTLFSRALCSQLTNSYLSKSPRALFFFFFLFSFFSSYQSNRQIVAYCFPPAHKCRNGDNLHKRQCQHFLSCGRLPFSLWWESTPSTPIFCLPRYFSAVMLDILLPWASAVQKYALLIKTTLFQYNVFFFC